MRRKSIISILMLVVCSGALWPAIGCKKAESPKTDQPPKEETKPMTYYVDADKGNDNNPGTGINSAWKSLDKINAMQFNPGDSILLQSGDSWEGQLLLKGAGVDGKPIVLSNYGTGNKPHIKGEGKVDHVILLENVDHWTLNNLEISNQASQIGNRTGIMIRSLNGSKKHFHITNMYIHDVMGDYSFETKGKNTGGIGIIGGPSTRFDDILIENCEIGPVNRVGIFTNLTDARNATRGNRPITNLVIRKNKIHHCAGDGAIIRYAYKPVISHNVAYDNHNADENLVKHGVALWCRSTDEALFEYNEVYNTRGSMDGQAFDADLDSYRTIVQYNYSHDNEGGFMLVYGTSSDAIVRYNISANDGLKGKHIFDFPVWESPRGSGIFHNNTIVIPEGVEAVLADEALETARFYNNIFYNKGTGKTVIRSGGKTAYFHNNSFVGYQTVDIPDSAPLLLDPKLTSPDNVQTGYNSTNGFRLGTDSPYGDKGIAIKPLENKYWLPNEGVNDFGDRPLNVKPIGAYLK